MGKKDKRIEEYILNYLNKTFWIGDGKVYTENNKEVWAYETITEVEHVFGFNRELISDIIKVWIEYNGVDWNRWNTLRKINAKWSPEMAQDIAAYHGIDMIQAIEAALIAEISKEIDANIIANITNFSELENKMKEIGYKKEVTEYSQMDFMPTYQFVRNSE